MVLYVINYVSYVINTGFHFHFISNFTELHPLGFLLISRGNRSAKILALSEAKLGDDRLVTLKKLVISTFSTIR